VTPLQSLILKTVCINVPIGILLLGPKDAVLKYIWAHRFDAKSSLRTWHYETLVVCALVAAVVILSGNDPVEWVGFAALTLAHGRNSVMFRLTEAQQHSNPVDPHHVECWRWNTIYFLLAECFWAGYFVLHRSWAALAGVAIFVGHGQWRRWYGRRTGKRIRWDGIDIVKVDLQKRAIQKELGIDAMGSCFFCGGPQLYWMRLNYAKDGVVTASKRIPVCAAHPPLTLEQGPQHDQIWDEDGDCRLCGAEKPATQATKGRVHADGELTLLEAWNTKKECDWSDCDAPLAVGHKVCPECRRGQIQPKFKEPDLIRVHPSTCMCNVCMTTT
jgi:hypothetical protein